MLRKHDSLLRVWQAQLEQFASVGRDMAEAIVTRYPSPRLLLQVASNRVLQMLGIGLLCAERKFVCILHRGCNDVRTPRSYWLIEENIG